MNRLVFLLQFIATIGFFIGALRRGKEALLVFICLQGIFANLFVVKQIELFGWQVTASDIFAIGALIGLNFLQEFYGKNEANRALWINFIAMIFFVIMTQIHLLFEPSSLDRSQEAYQTILLPAPRLFISSLVSFFVIQRTDIYIFSYLKEKFSRLSLTIRGFISLFISQCLDSLLFTLLAFAGTEGNLLHLFFFSFLLKILVLSLFQPVLRPLAAWVKKRMPKTA